MLIINRPPPPQQLIIRGINRIHLSRHMPRLRGTNEMDHADGTLEVSVGRNILIIGTGRAIIREAETVPVAEMLIQQSLVGAIETRTSLSKGPQGIVVLQIGPKDHQAAVETVGPADIWGSGEVRVQGQELIRGSESYHVAVNVDDAVELSLAPEFDLGE